MRVSMEEVCTVLEVFANTTIKDDLDLLNRYEFDLETMRVVGEDAKKFIGKMYEKYRDDPSDDACNLLSVLELCKGFHGKLVVADLVKKLRASFRYDVGEVTSPDSVSLPMTSPGCSTPGVSLVELKAPDLPSMHASTLCPSTPLNWLLSGLLRGLVTVDKGVVTFSDKVNREISGRLAQIGIIQGDEIASESFNSILVSAGFASDFDKWISRGRNPFGGTYGVKNPLLALNREIYQIKLQILHAKGAVVAQESAGGGGGGGGESTVFASAELPGENAGGVCGAAPGSR